MKYHVFKAKLLMLGWKPVHSNIINPPTSFKPQFKIFMNGNNTVTFVSSNLNGDNHNTRYRNLLFIGHSYTAALNLIMEHSK